MSTQYQILSVERGGHRLLLDFKEGFFRVCCNGAVYATFNATANGEIDGLKKAVAHIEAMEKQCFDNPKS